MVAVKANKQYTITEAEKKSYLAQGYDIIGDNGGCGAFSAGYRAVCRI